VKKSTPVKTNKKTKHKYVESHWLIFAIQGIIAISVGAYVMFTDNQDISYLVGIVGSVLIGLAIIELLNTIYRHQRQHNWGIAFSVAIFEAAVGTTMIFASSASHELHIALLAGYTLVRGVTSIVIGFASFDNLTDRFLWVTCGMVGSVIAFVIFADQGLSHTTFIKLFSTFLMVFGLTNIFFAIHSRDEKLQQLRSSKKAKT
jgi:uncharacterized membrane protein HdeD (DUF308 family)